MSTPDEIRHKFMMWGSLLGLLVVLVGALSLHFSRTGLSGQVFDDAMAACAREDDPDACRSNVEDLHDDCFRWALTRHDERPEIDREKYELCLEHPPGRFR